MPIGKQSYSYVSDLLSEPNLLNEDTPFVNDQHSYHDENNNQSSIIFRNGHSIAEGEG